MNKLAKKLLESNVTTAKSSPCEALQHQNEKFSLSEEEETKEDTI